WRLPGKPRGWRAPAWTRGRESARSPPCASRSRSAAAKGARPHNRARIRLCPGRSRPRAAFDPIRGRSTPARRIRRARLPVYPCSALTARTPGGSLYVAANEARLPLDVRLDDLGGGGSRADPRAEHPRPERPGPEDERVDRHGEGERHAAGEGEPEVQERPDRVDLQGEGGHPGEPRRHRHDLRDAVADDQVGAAAQRAAVDGGPPGLRQGE